VPGSTVIVVRRARPSDRGAILELSREAFGEYSKDPVRTTGALLGRDEAFGLIADAGGRVVGFAVVHVTRDGAAWLDAIAVSPSARGTGVGQVLLGSVEQECRERDCRRLGLATADANLSALSLFLKSGFQIERRRPRYYERGQNAVEMSKRLGA
jgi:ribosomal protein S18 acetylase RimI-like enzyme